MQRKFCTHRNGFLSTPSARRATRLRLVLPLRFRISIHALREEGDCRLRKRKDWATHFYPRPPRGGRQQKKQQKQRSSKFLSTPSARRATKTLPRHRRR